MTNIMNPIEIANQAYDKDFRWWFLALLVAVMGLGLWAFKYLLSRSESQDKQYAIHVQSLMQELTNSRQNHHDRMEALNGRSIDLVREVTAIVASNNKLIESNTRESEKVRAVIERMERK